VNGVHGTSLHGPDAALLAGLRLGQRRALAKAITLIESTRSDHRERAQQLLQAVLGATGGAIRLGITGVPGVGKSSFIETLGLYLLERGHRIAVLAIDPSSVRGGGSILGDKTRMEQLARRDQVFIRPSPSAGALGGVAACTREAMLLCEAAGFDVIIVETVGVGQSETAVAAMTDSFVLMQLPNAGDELQAIKKGVVELADLVVYNKTDLDPAASRLAQGQMSNALHLLRAASPYWPVPVLAVSASRGEGIDAFWQALLAHRACMQAHGELAAKRSGQALDWMWTQIEAGLRARFLLGPGMHAALQQQSAAVLAGTVTPAAAAAALLDAAAGASAPAGITAS
jgi:LAO/AO transport system kinase